MIKPRNMKNKRVYCYHLNKYFSSAAEASRKTGAPASSIIKACRGKLVCAGGMWWCYGKDRHRKEWGTNRLHE